MLWISKPGFATFGIDGMVAKELATDGVETTAYALLVGHHGKIIYKSARGFEPDYSIVLSDDWIDRVTRRALVEIDRRLVPIPDAVRMLRPVADSALPMAVARGSIWPALASDIQHLEIDGIVKNRYVSSHDDGKHKLLPNVYLQACAGLTLAQGRGVEAGDFRSSVTSPLSVGLTVIDFASNSDTDSLLATGATKIIERMADLSSVLSV